MSDHLIAEANRHARALIIERDQIRTELALLREWQREVIQNANAHHAERREANARAERAEAEVADLKANNRFQRGHSAGYAEAKADCEAELATERARLDYLSTLGFEHRHHETGDHLGHEWTISSYGESEDVTLRDVIDAEMQEGAK
jgi:hypothetical protein